MKSQDNPADLVSRCSALDTPALQHFWLNGPAWLTERNLRQEEQADSLEMPEEVQAERKAEITTAAAAAENDSTLIQKRFSSWGKVVRIAAYMLRFIGKASKKGVPGELFISASEFREAEKKLLMNVQKKTYAVELEKRCADLSKSSALFRLSPYIDQDGWIRCRSRLEKATGMPH